jgi:maltooligosyltrehalose trehalohydrolase
MSTRMDRQGGVRERVEGPRPARAQARALPIGAEVVPGGGVRFRTWAPKHRTAAVVLEAGPGAGRTVELEPEGDGFFSATAPVASAGTRYRLRLGHGGNGAPVADPASRFQADGPHGPSGVVDPSSYRWADRDWRGPASVEGQVFYELHVGTFTPEGTWAAAAEQLAHLADLGVTAVELMPVSEFPGRFGWSYDGVGLFAPFHGYGAPDDFRRFVDRAHALGLAVLLDVVYNHLGPEGNVLKDFSDGFFSRRHRTEWGEALNFDGEGCGPVREFVLANAAYWVGEFHLDGLRVDATQSLFDVSGDHILKHIARAARAAAGGRRVLVVGESEQQRARIVRPESEGGMGFDLLWSDDFHHAAVVAATGTREGYYGDYVGTPQELVSVVKRGWLYQGQWNLRQSKRRGSPAFDLPPSAFISYLQNHDQLANSARGERLHKRTSPGRYRALTALQLLGPATPLLFQGQEYAASSPFLYFGDLRRDVADEMHRGRQKFVRQFPSLATAEMQARVPHPADPETFARSKLDPSERDKGTHAEALALHRDLLRLRRDDPTLRAGQRPGAVDGAVLGPEALVLRWSDPRGKGDDRLLLLNLGVDLRLPVAAEPLLAPPEGKRWRVLWSTEDPRYGGTGTPEPETEEHNWRLKGHAAVVMAPADATEDQYRNPPGSV